MSRADLLTAHRPGHYLPVWLVVYEKLVQDGAARPHPGEGSVHPCPTASCHCGLAGARLAGWPGFRSKVLSLTLFAEPPRALAAHYLSTGGQVGEVAPRGGPITAASPPCTALDVFSQVVKPSSGRGNLWGAQGSIIHGPSLDRVRVRWLWLNLISWV